MPLSPRELEECARVLRVLVDDRSELLRADAGTRRMLLEAAGRVSRPERSEQRQLSRAGRKVKKQAVRAADDAQRERAGIRQARLRPVFITPHPLASREAEGGSYFPGAPRLLGDEVDRAVDRVRPIFRGGNRDAGAAVFDPAPAPRESHGREGAPGFETSPNSPPELENARACYVCKAKSARMHVFYDQLCGPCGDFNYQKRSQTADLRGRVALITGARVKIGYQAAVMLLRAGARVIVTTRFPHDAALRFSREVDFAAFAPRLTVYGLDLRHTPSVEMFARHLSASEARLDFVLHNACQTVRRPVGFYSHLMTLELAPHGSLPADVQPLVRDQEELRATVRRTLGEGARTGTGGSLAVGLYAAASLSQVALSEDDRGAALQLFPVGQLDADLQQVDLRPENSWRLALDQVGTVELLEVQLVNAIAPFVLNARLKPLMLRHRTFDKHIVNVSAMEGQFYRRFKTDKHPHTNMAKAALNMMTRTSAPDFARDGIFMNSVDTGWITDEDAAPIAARKVVEKSFHPPLDIVDGAARIVDPIFTGINTGKHVWGQFLKDYQPTAW